MSTCANLYDVVAQQFIARATAFETPDRQSYSYKQVEKKSASAALAFLSLGLRKGDRVSIIADKSLDYIWIYLGCLRAGLIFHPINPSYTTKELTYLINDANPRLLLLDPAAERKVRPILSQLRVNLWMSMSMTVSKSFVEKMFALENNAGSFQTISVQEDDCAALIYSSGTTGQPKGIEISHRNLAANAQTLKATWKFCAKDTLVHVLPLYHVHGLFITLNTALLAGCKIKFLKKFSTTEVIKQLKKATILAGVPTFYARLLEDHDFSQQNCKSMRVFISGSAPLPEGVFRDFETRTGHQILERYGMTETGIISSNPLSGPRIPGSVGAPLEGVEIRITNPEKKIVNKEDIGAIEVRGESVFGRYWNLPEATRQAFDDKGWFNTGDQGYMKEGNLYIVGRSKDLVITGGLNVYPKEVENEIEKHQLITESAVFGVSHPDFGEAVLAAVVSKEEKKIEEKVLLAFLKENLAPFKVPKNIFCLKELPRNAMGKIQKNLLRERFKDTFAKG